MAPYLLGPLGERAVNHYSFYAAFTSPEEYRLFMNGRALGTVPADPTLYADVAADLRRPPLESLLDRPPAQSHRSGARSRRPTARISAATRESTTGSEPK